MSIIGDMFFESTAVTADLLLEEQGVGAAIALRVRVSSAAKNIRGVTPGVFLYIGATPGLVSAGGHDNPGGTTPAPNTPQVGWTLCADSYCDAVLKHGPMPASQGITPATAVVGRWYTVTLEVTDDVVAGWIDKVSVFSKVSIAPSPPPPPPPPVPPPSPTVVQQCVENTSLLVAGKVIAGGDYRQVTLPPPGNSSTDIQDCSKACCADGACSAWAVAKGKCWLKDHGWSISKMAGGEDACAIKPAGPAPPPTPPPPATRQIPPSGWAAIAATIGRSQVDNFKLAGTAGGGAAVSPCATEAPRKGSAVVTTPCDYPRTVAGWIVTSGGAIQLGQPGSSPGDDSSTRVSTAVLQQLCVGVAPNATKSDDSAVALVACGSELALAYNVTTGRISPRGDGSRCATAVQRTFNATGAATMVLSACLPTPSEAQQFQYNPRTGALRPKASSCIATSQGEATRVQYRDCCIALCN